MKGLAAVVFVAVVLVVGVLLLMVFGALGIGAANAWFLDAPFAEGWNAAWDKPLVLFGWSLLFVSGAKIAFNSN